MPWAYQAKHGDELDLVSIFLPKNPIILEAGGHYGEDTVIMAKKWPHGTILSFEPNPYAFKQLRNVTKEFPNIRIYPLGLFSKTGAYTFNVNTITDGSSSLFDDNHMPEVTWYNDTQIRVHCVNLDEWASRHKIKRIDYMWLDMEGAEFEVLAAAPKILGTVRAISTEVNFREFRKNMAQFEQIRTLLESQGFTLYKIWGIPDWQGTAVFIRENLL